MHFKTHNIQIFPQMELYEGFFYCNLYQCDFLMNFYYCFFLQKQQFWCCSSLFIFYSVHHVIINVFILSCRLIPILCVVIKSFQLVFFCHNKVCNPSGGTYYPLIVSIIHCNTLFCNVLCLLGLTSGLYGWQSQVIPFL